MQKLSKHPKKTQRKRINYHLHIANIEWQLTWHQEDRMTKLALTKFLQASSITYVLAAIYYSKLNCRHYSAVIPYMNQIITEWQKHQLKSVDQIQAWMRESKLKIRPWNQERRDRILGAHRLTVQKKVISSKHNHQIPDVFKKHSNK